MKIHKQKDPEYNSSSVSAPCGRFFFFFFFTSRMKNLAVFTFDQVFFSLETGLMFIPATSEKEEKSTMDKSWVSWFICDS